VPVPACVTDPVPEITALTVAVLLKSKMTAELSVTAGTGERTGGSARPDLEGAGADRGGSQVGRRPADDQGARARLGDTAAAGKIAGKGQIAAEVEDEGGIVDDRARVRDRPAGSTVADLQRASADRGRPE